MRTIIRYILPVFALAGTLAMHGCFNIDEHPFDEIGRDVYYKDENSIKGVIAGIYSVGFNNIQEELWSLQEFPADQITFRQWSGGSYGWDEGKRYVLTTQTWTPVAETIRLMWERCWEAIGLCNSALEDFSRLDPAKLGMTRTAFDAYVAEVRTKRVFLYSSVYDLWGGALPLATSAEGEVPGSASSDFNEGCRIIFDFFIKELDESLAALPVNEVNRMTKAANRVLKARLLLNAGVYIGEERFTECATICEEIMRGDYGTYQLATDWTKIYAFDNDKCTENIFAYACDPAQLKPNWIRNITFLPNNMNGDFFTGATVMDQVGVWNCTCLVPSFDNSASILAGGTPRSFLSAPYNDKLGAVYERFDNRDIRKRNFSSSGDTYSGLFLRGPMMRNYGTSNEPILGSEEYNNEPLVYVDQVGTFRNNGRQLEPVMSPRWGEANSGVRMIRYPYYSGHAFTAADEVEMRLSEVYFMLAECRMRAGNSDGAKALVNDVRKRYYTAADWTTVENIPGPGFTAFDMDWMLSEWGKEFLNEGHRRRTDLRRFDKFTQGQWWFFGRAVDPGVNLPAQRDRKYEWYPLPQMALIANERLTQNPNYR